MKLGIDFGTCYSSAALLIDGVLRPAKEPLKPLESCFPSSVCVTKKGDIVISQAAENQRRLNPQGYKTHFKRDLETDIPYFLGEQQLRFMPEELVTIMLAGLKKETEKIINSSLDSAVITVPATYLMNKKKLMEEAGKKAGFTQVTLLEEPVAAAIYYSQKGTMGHQLKEGDILLIYDLGGGTFDAALIQKKGNSYELLCQPVGDKQCGGIYFDQLIAQDFSKQLQEDSIRELLTSHRPDQEALRAKLNLLDWCRNFKHQLSMVDEYEDFPPVGLDSYSLSREKFEEMITPFIDSSCNLCQQLVQQSRIKWESINRVLLVGGSCRIPLVQKRLEQQFNRPVVAIDDPELAICFGAAIYGLNLEEIRIKETERKRQEQDELERLRREREAELQRQRQEEAKRKAEEAQMQRELEVQRQRWGGAPVPALNPNEEEKKRRLKEDLGNGVILELVEIPAGSFMMGSNDYDDEKPIHQVNINYSFLMGKYPITQAQYQAIMGNNPSRFKDSENATLSKGGWGDRPVENVSWDMAKAFCDKLSATSGRAFRLPSEAEWEYACRAGSTTKYFFGNNENDLDKYAWFGNNSNSETHPVGGKNPNPWQLYDILGNVWEWCEDDWQDNYNGVPCDGSSKKLNSNTKVLRGGSWSFNSLFCRCASRCRNSRDYINYYYGFRVALAFSSIT